MKKNGFTLIELLVVIAILAILLSIGMSKGIRKVRINAKKAQAMVEMKSIETAVKAYANKYGKLPAEHGSDIQIDLTQAEQELESSENLISTLSMADNADENLNPARMVFLEPQTDGSDGTFKDPWGYQYRVALDTDYDGQLTIDDETIRRKVALVSVGLYFLNNAKNTNDLVKSWN